MRHPIWPALALCAVVFGTLPGCDSGGDTGGGGDLRVLLSTSDIAINDIAQGGFSIYNVVTVVATVEGADAVTGVSVGAANLGAALDSTASAGPGRIRAYVRLQNCSSCALAEGPTTLRIETDGGTAEVPLTVHLGNAQEIRAAGSPPVGVQLAHGREALYTTSAVHLRVADMPAGFSLREEASGTVVRTYATAAAAVVPNVAHRGLVHMVTAEGWAYGTAPIVVVARSVVPNAAVHVRTRSLVGGRHYSAPTAILYGVAQNGGIVSRSFPGGNDPTPQLTGLRGAVGTGGRHSFLLYRDGRVGRTVNGAEREVRFLGDLDPADVAPDGSLLMRDGSVWFTGDSPGFQTIYAAVGITHLDALPASAETGFVAITSDLVPVQETTPTLTLAAAADGRLWAASRSQRLAPTAQRLASAPREMVGLSGGVYGARLADGSVWTWRAAAPGQPASLTAPGRLDGVVAARLFTDENALVVVRADGRVATWGQVTGDGCTAFVLCERPDRAGLREAAYFGYVRADGLAYHTADAGLAFGSGQAPLVASE